MTTETEPVADAAMDAKMREIWARIEKPWVRNILRESLPPTPVEVMGCRFIVHPRDNFTEAKMWENRLPPEHEATAEIAARLAGTDPVIVDVGANAGAFFLPILKTAGPGARAIAFEPNPVMIARLRRNIDLNGFENIDVFECAVGEDEGRATLHFPRNGNLGQGRIGVTYANGTEAGHDVAVRPLATCLSEARVPRVDFLKVNVEGLEDRVIAPLLAGVRDFWPRLVYFEIAHDGVWTHPLLQILSDRGYEEVRSYGRNSLFKLKGTE
jgi:FkbM family methyltransferase